MTSGNGAWPNTGYTYPGSGMSRVKRRGRPSKVKKQKTNYDVTFVPIANWPGVPNRKPKKSQFGKNVPFRETITLLERELKAVKATDILVQSYFEPHEIKSTGYPMLSSQPSKPGIILTFKDQSGKTLSFPCDTYKDWTDNLKAIAKVLGALRQVERYGVGKNEQYYHGFALPPPGSETVHSGNAERSDFEKAIQVVSKYSGIPLTLESSDETIQEALKIAYVASHPDKPEGSAEAFVQVTAAKKILVF